MSRERMWRVLPPLLLLLYIVVGLATLTTFPLIWGDEGWYVQSAWSFARDGTFALPMFDGLAGFGRDNVVYGRVYLLALAAAFRVVDAATPEAARFVSFASGIVALVSMYGLGRELWNTRVGVLAAVLLAVSPVFIDQNHDARPEIMQVAFTLTAFYLLLAGERRGSALLTVGAGILAVLAADVHLNGVIVPISLAAVLLVRRSGRRTFLWFVVGCATASAWWLYVHVIRDPDLFVAQASLYGAGNLPLRSLLDQPVFVIGMGLARWFRVDTGSIALLVVGLVAAYELIRRHNDRALRSVLAFAGVQVLFFALIVGNTQPIYAVLLWPVPALLVARLLTVIPQRLAVAIGAVVVAISLGAIGQVALRDRDADYDSYLAQVRSAIPDDAVVLGQPALWFGFTEQPFVATQYFVWSGPFADEVRRKGVEYVIGDEYFMDLQLRYLGEISAHEVESFLTDHGEVILEIEDPFYGRLQAPREAPTGHEPPYVTRIYRIDPPGPSDQP